MNTFLKYFYHKLIDKDSSPMGVVETPANSSFNSSYLTLTMVSMLQF